MARQLTPRQIAVQLSLALVLFALTGLISVLYPNLSEAAWGLLLFFAITSFAVFAFLEKTRQLVGWFYRRPFRMAVTIAALYLSPTALYLLTERPAPALRPSYLEFRARREILEICLSICTPIPQQLRYDVLPELLRVRDQIAQQGERPGGLYGVGKATYDMIIIHLPGPCGAYVPDDFYDNIEPGPFDPAALDPRITDTQMQAAIAEGIRNIPVLAEEIEKVCKAAVTDLELTNAELDRVGG